jgi:AcrR family transcriptional regulator
MDDHRTGRAARRGHYHHGDLRTALLEAGEAELAACGIEGFSLRGVAKRAGVSHAAPAHHYGDVNALLTALAARGFRRFLEFQKARKKNADQDSLSQLVAAGMGYIDFAIAHPALFRLMFSSYRPNHDAKELRMSAGAAYRQLLEDVKALHGSASDSSEPEPAEVMRAWAIVHGFATLSNSKRLKPLLHLRKSDRDSAIEAMLRRSLT